MSEGWNNLRGQNLRFHASYDGAGNARRRGSGRGSGRVAGRAGLCVVAGVAGLALSAIGLEMSGARHLDSGAIDPVLEGSSFAPLASTLSGFSSSKRSLRPGTSLDAAPLTTTVGDLDHDGLPDAVETILRTDPFFADTDGDGFGDGEEFSRQSDPLLAASVPNSNVPSAALSAYASGEKLRVTLVIHEPEFQFGDALVRFGVFANGSAYPVPLERLLPVGNIIEVVGTCGSRVTTYDVPIEPAFVHSQGTVSFFVATGSITTQILSTANKIDVHSDGVLLTLRNTPRPTGLEIQASQGGGTIRQPLPVSSTPPPAAGSIAGAVCFQRSEVIGVNGPRVLHRIVEADCVEGWDSFCSSDCAATAGDTYETVDPWSLIGGD